MKKINEIIDCNFDTNIYGITDDSRLVKEGYLFVATKGYNVDHYDFIFDAISNGCSFVICDRKIDYDIPYLIVDDVNSTYIMLCKKFFDINLDNYNFIGITGTDGKTTTTSIIYELLNNGSYIGTNGFYYCGKHLVTDNTTPCISELYKYLRIINDNKISDVAMEVSSEALLHNRVSDFTFKIIGFTNITGDHLNVHKTFENYVESKYKLLNYINDNSIVVINGDDIYLHNIKCKNMFSFGFNEDNDFTISGVKYINDFCTFNVNYNDNIYCISSPLVGIHNVYNVTMAFVICLLYGYDSTYLINKISCLNTIPGRCEFLDFGQPFKIVLDYAHTVNGIKNILKCFSNYEEIICVTGCAGGRDSSKRKDIGKLVIDNSSIAIFTMDDPRNEDVDKIIDEMVGDEKDYIRIKDRSDAISYALSIAHPNSIVLILGKGRDGYMAVGDEKISYSDYDVIENYFK